MTIGAFVAYRHSGEDPEVLQAMLGTTCEALGKVGVDPYCMFYDELAWTKTTSREIMGYAFPILRKNSLLIPVLHSPNKSEGMLIEVGYALAIGKPIIAAVQNEIAPTTIVPDMANAAIRWEDLDDLARQIEATDFNTLLATSPQDQ